jgi:pyruvate dehydrogenase E2 component (dihydrolipoamide acetyltransferase)
MDVKLPKLGEGADAGVVVNLFVKEGEVITKDQPILELESEKAVASVPSPAAGLVTQIHVKPGDKVSVGQRILTLGDGAGAAAAPQPEVPASAAAPKPAAPSPTPAPAGEPAPVLAAEEASVASPPAAAPSVRLIAKELGLDLTRIRGSQRGGRIVMADLRAYIERLQQLAARATAAAPVGGRPAKEPVDFARWGPVIVKPLSPLRQVIARRMAESWAAVARVTQFDDADVTRLLDLRKQHLAAYEAKGVRLTLTGFVLKALVGVLQKHPTFNASLDHTEANLVLKSYVHIGIAVDTEAGLMVPVIRDADKKSLVELSRELEDLARKARERKVSADELKGGTFTISNQGGIGGAHFTPVINLPEVAILGLGRGAMKPVWRNGKFEPRTLLPLALSYDHRVIDGGGAARFIVDLVQAIEQFDESLARI